MSELELSELLRFIVHPVKYFFNHTLQLYFAPLVAVELDDETFLLDALSRYQLLNGLAADKLGTLDTKVPGESQDAYARLRAAGSLPHRDVGKLAFGRLDEQASAFVAALPDNVLSPLEPLEVNLTVRGVRLLGWVKQLTTHGLLFYRPAKINAKDRLTAWLHHVVLAAMGRGVKTTHIGLAERLELKPLPQPQAQAIVDQLMDFYLRGRAQPQPFFAKSSEQWCETEDINKVAKVFNGSSFNQIPGEGDDLYIQRVYGDVNALPEAFGQLAKMVYGPLFAAVADAATEAQS